MNLKDAKAIRDRLSGRDIPSDEDFFYYTEAMDYLIEKKPNPHYMIELGAQYRYRRYFDMELKYYEMAASYGDITAMVGLGNFWFSGSLGQPDYKKAYEYFSKAPKNMWVRCKIADMYKNGLYLTKSYSIYRNIIEELNKEVKKCKEVYDPIAEVLSRVAELRANEGREQEAIVLYTKAKEAWAKWIPHEPCWENLSLMHTIVDKLYKLREPDFYNIDLYDLFELLKKPIKIRLFCTYNDKEHIVEAVEEDNEVVICYEDKWYRNVDDFFNRAETDGKRLVTIHYDWYDLEVI